MNAKPSPSRPIPRSGKSFFCWQRCLIRDGVPATRTVLHLYYLHTYVLHARFGASDQGQWQAVTVTAAGTGTGTGTETGTGGIGGGGWGLRSSDRLVGCKSRREEKKKICKQCLHGMKEGLFRTVRVPAKENRLALRIDMYERPSRYQIAHRRWRFLQTRVNRFLLNLSVASPSVWHANSGFLPWPSSRSKV